jgi:hypothetical protein
MILEKGQPVVLRVATDVEEREFSGVVQSLDRAGERIALEIQGRFPKQRPVFLGKEATLVGKSSRSDLDLPCVVVEENRFPILICQRVNRRNHVRVNAFIPLQYCLADRGLYEDDREGYLIRIREEMGGSEGLYEAIGEGLEEESVSPKLVCLLEDMNRKLDRILALLEENRHGQLQRVVAVNISGSGLRFPVWEEMKGGELLAIRVVLPLAPPVPVIFLGEVTRVTEKGKDEFDIAVRFVAIDEADREKIVQYTFKRMRESVRNRFKTTGLTS